MTRSVRPAVAVIGASGGLGTALTSRALARDVDVWAYNRDASAPWGDAEAHRVLPLDLADLDQVESVELPNSTDLTVFWVAGFFVKGALQDTSTEEIAAAVSVMLHHPLLLLRRLLSVPRHSFHLVTVASSSSWKAREHEVVYCAVKAAQAAATRQLLADVELAAERGRVTLVQPGGLAVPNFHGQYANNIGQMLDVAEVADLVWSHVDAQTAPFEELQVLRQVNDAGGAVPLVHLGARAPETPTSRHNA